MNASMRFIVWGVMPIGSLIGGALGSVIGIRAGIAVGAVGGLFAVLWLATSPIRVMREPPPPWAEAMVTHDVLEAEAILD